MIAGALHFVGLFALVLIAVAVVGCAATLVLGPVEIEDEDDDDAWWLDEDDEELAQRAREAGL